MDKQVQLLAEPELQTLRLALITLDGAITGLSFDSGGMILFIHGSDFLTDQQIQDTATLHPIIDHQAKRDARLTASKVLLGNAKGNDVGTMPPPELTQIMIAIGQTLGIIDENGIIE